MFDCQELESIGHRSQVLEKEKEGTFKNVGLVAAQCNGIAACAYSLKIFTVHTLLYLTVWSVGSLRPLFIFLFDKRAPNTPD